MRRTFVVVLFATLCATAAFSQGMGMRSPAQDLRDEIKAILDQNSSLQLFHHEPE